MRAISILVRAALVAACLAGAVASFIGYSALQDTARVFKEMLRGGASETMAAQLEDAETPLYPDVVRETTQAVVLTRLGRAAEAERLLLRAAEREPENQIVWVTLARVQATLGKKDAARASAARSAELNSQTPALDSPPPIDHVRP